MARVCLNLLRARDTRREEPLDDAARRQPAATGTAADPAEEVQLADEVGIALLIVLDTLGPAERLAFVLHDMFDVPFDDIAAMLDKTPPPPASWPAAPAAGSGASPRPKPTCPAGAAPSTPTWRPPAAATSTRWWPCCTRTSS